MLRAPLVISLAIAATAAVAGQAHGEDSTSASVRQRRPRSVVVAPAMLAVRDHDVTIPLPSVRLGFAVSRRLSIELGGGGVPLRYGAYMLFADLGVRWFVRDHGLSPYLMTRAGTWRTRPDEGDPYHLDYLTAGAGLEWATSGGFTAAIEIGPALVAYQGHNLGGTFSAGAGYRF